jgi:NAD(P)-dependent dehydrogenase (short-subunit alcohol dehydrogenase family)
LWNANPYRLTVAADKQRHFQKGSRMTTSGRIVFVAGGTSGIGAAIARRFLEADDTVFVCGSSHAKVAALVETHHALGTRYHAVVADLSIHEERRRVFDEVMARHGRIDILVNCAGYSTPSPILDFDLEAWRRQMSVNLEAAAVMSTYALDEMRKLGRGRIINIGSVYGTMALNGYFYVGKYAEDTERGAVRTIAYAASKGGLVNLSRDMAAAAAPLGVTVNCISPGMIDVETKEISPERQERFAKATPVGRLGRGEDIAEAVFFLASDGASFITGQNINVDGGWSIW